MSVGWRTACASDLPEGDGWLGAAERAKLATLVRPGRRADYRLGRHVAKRAVAEWLVSDVAPGGVEILAAADGAPEAWRHGARLPCALSISHRDGLALCAVTSAGTGIGCDLERIETRAPSFEREWLGDAERRAVCAATGEGRDLLVTLSWSAKESALKALRTGLRRDPRDVGVAASGLELGRGVLHVACAPDAAAGFPSPLALRGFWERRGDHVYTVIAEGLREAPRALGRAAGA